MVQYGTIPKTIKVKSHNIICSSMKAITFIALSLSLFFLFHCPTSAMSLASATRRAVGKLCPKSSVLLVCDVQERFRGLIHNYDTVIHTTKFMTSVAKELQIPCVVTQQYTKVFGPTIPEAIADPNDLGTNNLPVFEKKLFSMCTEECSKHLASLSSSSEKTSYLIVGIEAHVCLQQTCLDLLEQGHDVHIIADGVSSQQKYDREIALKRMEQSGAWITTCQSAAFMLLGGADNANFKAVSKLVKEHMALKNAAF